MEEPLQRGIAAGFHALAQPVTILRARFDAEMIELMDEAQLRRNALRSSRQVEHLCGLLRSMQRLLEFDSIPSVLEETAVSPLMECVVEDVGRVLDEAGILLHLQLAEDCPLVLADRGRLRQAMVDALMLACEIAKGETTVDLLAEATMGGVRVQIAHREACCEGQRDRLRLSVAALEANLVSQGGSMRFQESPFRVEFQLPCAR